MQLAQASSAPETPPWQRAQNCQGQGVHARESAQGLQAASAISAAPRSQARPSPQPEPKPIQAATLPAQFVVQKHAARRVHYDLRLELDGTLKSWAVTRGPSLTLGEKRLAVRTEDHPIEYLDFEGNIPKGEYGGGAMIVWDRGRWIPRGRSPQGARQGPSRHSRSTARGSRAAGTWCACGRGAGEKTEPWLLIKAEDEFARQPGEPEITDEETTSLLSGRTNAGARRRRRAAQRPRGARA